MRLRQIRISGFKSFADLTVIEVPSSIVGIVGPNGCGKSNVIEAVRWALGEGKASDLRCKSMSELIFAGSDNRKPAGRAMVELVFDNSDGALQGPWGSYVDISVKRVLTRDNTSSYLINNQQVRATDVRDLFMGTGLGANSYAIISQGMVTEFAKDSPEKRREYLEEAAGVSKYKKRRKEAESKLASTRANLERVSDLQVTRRESLKRLEEEARVAEEYQQLNAKREAQESLWWFTQMVEAKNAIDRINAQVSAAQAEVGKNDSELNRLRQNLQQLRSKLNDANITVLGKTQALAEVDKQISAVEGNIRSIVERRALMKTQLESYRSMLEARGREVSAQGEKIHALSAEREEKEELVATANEREAALEEKKFAAEELAHQKELAFEALQKESQRIENESRNLSLELARLSKTKEELTLRLEKFKREAAQTEAPDMDRFNALKEELSIVKEDSEALKLEREDAQALLEEAREGLTGSQSAIHEKEQRLAAITAKLTTLKELEEKSLTGDKLSDWLERQGLSSLTRLFEKLQPQAGWARALEAVLRERVNARISNLSMAAAFEMAPPPAKLTFYSTLLKTEEQSAPLGLTGLIEKVSFDHHNEETRASLTRWLSHYFVAESVKEAVSKVDLLPSGCHFVTPQGHMIDKVSVNFWEQLHQQMGEAHLKVSQMSERLQSANTHFETVRARESELALELTRLTAAIEAYQNRSAELGEWIEEAQAQLEETTAAIEEADERFSVLDEEVATRQQKSEDARLSWEAAREESRRAEQEFNVFAYTQREIELALKNLSERIAEAQRAQLLAQNEQTELKEKIETVSASLEELDEDSEKAGLQELLQKREAALAAVDQSKTKLSGVEAQVAESEKSLDSFEEAKRREQNRMGDLIAKRGQHEVEYGTVRSRLEEFNFDEEALRTRYETERPKLNALRQEVERIAQSMAQLGAVNHAALEQLKTQQAEVERIDREVADLEQAIATIEAAIKKIDHETRTLLLDTFNRVNEAFNQKFTQLFNGGHARLEMTSDDALEAGIEMFANPPGKHNHSIRQLSGGELTLTATALVFAFFTLNPAPFCLLDEIDAPLDEANQERLSRLVGAMSENTQFMMITHHRVTMEHTNQLIGVTMKEPGVSRVVSVDIAEASQYAQKPRVS